MMVMQKTFRSAMAKDILRYIRLKQALGRHFENGSRVLLSLDGFLSNLGKPSADLTPGRFQKWGQTLEPLSSSTKLARMQVVRNFCIYRRRVTPDCFVPDPSQFPKACPLLRPHIFSEVEVARLLGHCNAMPEDPARSPLRWAGTRLAIILLYTTGIRRGELFRLKPQDYDAGNHTLLIQASKFHKSRLLPLPDDVAKEVDKHLQTRSAAYPSALVTEPLLWSPYSGDRAYTGTRLQSNLRILFDRAGIKKTDGRRPRVHDFRHGFAVNALIRWYRAGVDVQAKLPLLATWLGHVSILSTYHYLHFVEDLRLAADSRFIDSYGSMVVPAPKNGVSR
jgi:integrase/recombinase XerD